jgi:hypothetical protein
MKTGFKKQRPPFQAAPELLLPLLVDEQTIPVKYINILYIKIGAVKL